MGGKEEEEGGKIEIGGREVEERERFKRAMGGNAKS